jgi:chorismate dehydratase
MIAANGAPADSRYRPMIRRFPSENSSAPNAGPRTVATTGLRVGAVEYLNTRPLVHGLSSGGLSVSYDLPSRLADRLRGGDLDVALVPSIELFRHPDHSIVSDACIGCRGPVMSVKLFFRTAPARVTTLAVDEGSRTSVVLSQILLARRYGVRPRLERLPLRASLADTSADAVLLIGDRALGPSGGPHGGGSIQVVWDLGDEWCRWSGLPFVFAVWAARGGIDAGGLAPSLAAARDAGLANLAAIAAAEAAGHGLTVPQCLSYLRDNLHYHLGSDERRGLEAFRRHAEELGLVDPVDPVDASGTSRRNSPESPPFPIIPS